MRPIVAAGSGINLLMWTRSGDIWGTADNFLYTHKTLQGDGEIIAKVDWYAHNGRPHPWSKAGVMIRESLDPGSRHASMFITGETNGAAFIIRTSTDGSSVDKRNVTDYNNVTYWVRLVRQGNIIRSYIGLDASDQSGHVVWDFYSSQSFSNLPDTLYYGAALSSHNGEYAAVAFDDVYVGEIGGGGVRKDVIVKEIGGRIGDIDAVATNPLHHTLKIVESGNLGGTSDKVLYGLQRLHGNGEAVVKLRGRTGQVPNWGLMLRESVAPNGRYVALLRQASPFAGSHNISSSDRLVAGGTGFARGRFGVGPNEADAHWLRIRRIGDLVKLDHSEDGLVWSAARDVTVPNLAETVFMGMAASHFSSTDFTLDFDEFCVNVYDDYLSTDIGNPAIVGNASVGAGGIFTVNGSGVGFGSAIDGTLNQYHFLYQPLVGDG